MAERLTFFLHESVAKARIRRLFDVIVEAPAEDTADANIGAASAGITDYERERILYSSLRRASNKTQNKLTNLWLFVS